MTKSKLNKPLSRREFINRGFRLTAGIGLAGVGIFLAKDASSEDMIWQIDPAKCVQCGRCATNVDQFLRQRDAGSRRRFDPPWKLFGKEWFGLPQR